MNTTRKPITILLADDDPDDCFFAQEALQESGLSHELRMVHDGEELLGYLFQRRAYSAPDAAPSPGVILLDLNMPGMDGREALTHIKSSAALRRIPVIVLTTSKNPEDIIRSYDLGATSYICKPVTFTGLVEAMQALGRYWFELVRLPREHSVAM